MTTSKITDSKRRPQRPADWPLPGLAFESDVHPHALDRPSICAALGVPEVWRFDGESLWIDRLGLDGMYSESPQSGWSRVRPEVIVRLLSIDADDDNDYASKAVDWARRTAEPRPGAEIVGEENNL